MNYRNLTREQKEWIKEIQRAEEKNRENFVYVPGFQCDAETGEVYRTEEGMYGGIERIEFVGYIPLKAIPYRARLLREIGEDRRQEEERRIEFRKTIERKIKKARERTQETNSPLQQASNLRAETPKLLRAEGEHHVHMFLAQSRKK